MAVQDTDESLLALGWKKRSLSGFASRFGPLWTKRDEEIWRYGVLPCADHLNPAGVVHGGVITSLLDHVMSTVAWEAADRAPCVTVQLDAKFFAPASAGLLLQATAVTVKVTSSLVFMHGTATQGGVLVAQGSAVMKALR